jgi:hypothetical protein
MFDAYKTQPSAISDLFKLSKSLIELKLFHLLLGKINFDMKAYFHTVRFLIIPKLNSLLTSRQLMKLNLKRCLSHPRHLTLLYSVQCKLNHKQFSNQCLLKILEGFKKTYYFVIQYCNDILMLLMNELFITFDWQPIWNTHR